ncbi:DUF3566 domain-containing protein [Nocardia sp. CNY236]|uniref:DUF3566 domain-containing protein n=1 Tax=Nocardia sp. CNY236 TaxID=1169152 RepID=UPI00048C2A03|nr:DUF3566 domain-containing protein [Nocardia sp. CNY236]
MTTPNQPNDERQQTNGVTERIAPSPIPPRPIPRPVAPAENSPSSNEPEARQGQQATPRPQDPPDADQERETPDQQVDGASQADAARGATNDDGDESGQKTVRMNPAAEQPAREDGAGAQQPTESPASGAQQSPYRSGWSQLPQREPQSNLNRPGQAPVAGRPHPASLGGGMSNARTTADLAAKAARKEAAMAKSVGIDGPTRSIARPELIKDMPDLSEIRHPLPPPTESAAPPALPVSPAMPVVTPSSGGPLRATVQIRRIDPWSTLKISLVISVAMFFVWMLAIGLLYIVLAGMGVWDRLNNTFTDMVSQDTGSVGLIDAGTVFGYAGVIGLINIVLFTALGTIGTFIYNQCCDLVGGIQVTLADPD